MSHTHKYDRITTSGGLARADNRDSVGWAPGSSTGVLEYTPPSGGKIEPHVVTMRGTINVNAAGTISSSTNYANVPPFYALYYIMKVSGTPHNFS